MRRLCHGAGHVLPRVVAGLLLLGVLSGCSTYATQGARIRGMVDEGDIEGALLDVRKEAGDDPDVLALMQEGLLSYYTGRYPESTAALSRAAELIDEQYTKSLTGEALAFLSNDQTRPYSGYPGEQSLLHIYSALAWLAEGKRTDAIIEARASAEQLTDLESLRGEHEAYTRDAFAEWIGAILYAEDADANACLVSCRRALSAYEESLAAWGEPIPQLFLEDYAMWAQRFGFDDERQELATRFGSELDSIPPLGRNEGEVALLFESGWVDHLEQVKLDFPILESDDFEDRDAWASAVAVRGPRGAYLVPTGARVKYWLSVAWPTLASIPVDLDQARLIVGDRSAPTELVQDVSAIFRTTFEEDAGERAVRTILRGLAKYVATKAAEDKSESRLVGFLANMIAAGSEVADTRSWTMLPDRMHMARLRLPAGHYTVQAEILDHHGEVARVLTWEDVRVVPGSRTLLHHRSYQ